MKKFLLIVARNYLVLVFLVSIFVGGLFAISWDNVPPGLISLPWATSTSETQSVGSSTFTSSGFTPSWAFWNFYSSMFGQSTGLSATVYFVRSGTGEEFDVTSPSGGGIFRLITKNPNATGISAGNSGGVVGGQVGSNTVNILGSVGFAGSYVQSSTLTANYTLYRMDASTGNVAVTMPAPAINEDSGFGGRFYRFLKADASTNTVTVVGSTSTILTYQGETVDYWREWTAPGQGNWWPIGRADPPGPRSLTKAVLNGTAPAYIGQRQFCSDCSTDGDVISTATTKGSWGRISARTTAIN
jgi:hypothetical protein